MQPFQIDKNLQLPVDNKLYTQVNWISRKVEYDKVSYQQLQSENEHILKTLKMIQNKLSVQLQQKKRNKVEKPVQSENVKALEDKIKNNQKLIASLRRDCESAQLRRSAISQGLQSKTIQTKFALEKTITKTKAEIRSLKLEQHQTVRKLSSHQDLAKPQNYESHQRMEEQLRVMSIKYVRLLDKYNKCTQKLGLVSNVELPDFPQDIYDKQLQEKEQAQFKQYEGIVKLCNVLAKRNDSEHNKWHREYTVKLKQLQKMIERLSQLDNSITGREGELMESKKNVELYKVKLNKEQNQDNKTMRLSQGSIPSNVLRRNSYSYDKILTSANQNHKYRTINEPKQQDSALRNRMYSLNRLKLK